MSAKDSEKFCRNTPEKPEEKNKKKFVFKNNKIYKPLSEFTDEDWKEASRRAEETDIRDLIDLDSYFNPDDLSFEAELTSTFKECDRRISIKRESRDGKYGLVDGNGRTICPFVCDCIQFLPPSRIASIKYKDLDFTLDRRYCWKSFLLYSDAWGIPYDLSIPYIIVFDSWDSFLARHRRELRELFRPCEMSDEELKAIYDEFMAIIQEHNSIITREEVLAMTDNDEVNEYLKM